MLTYLIIDTLPSLNENSKKSIYIIKRFSSELNLHAPYVLLNRSYVGLKEDFKYISVNTQ